MDASFFLSILTYPVVAVAFLRYQFLFDELKEKALFGLLLSGLIAPAFFREFTTSRTVLVASALVVGGSAILLFAVIAIAAVRRTRYFQQTIYGFEVVLILLALYNLVTASVGFLEGNQLTYITSDTYKLVVFPATYFLTLAIVDEEDLATWFRTIYYSMFLLMFISLGRQLVSPVSAEISAVVAFRYLIPILLMDVFAPSSARLFRFDRRAGMGLLVLALVNAFLSFSRGTWIITITLVIVFVLFSGHKLKIARYSVPQIPIVSGVVLTGMALGSWNTSTLWKYATAGVANAESDFNRISDIVFRRAKASGSLDQKIAEGVDAVIHMGEHGDFANYLFGMGNGATYQTVTSKQSGMIHNIHNQLFAQFFRRGLIGLGLVVAFYATTLLTFLRAWHNCDGTKQVLVGAAFLSLLAAFIYDMSAASSFFNIPLAIFFGLSGKLLRTEAV